jgi:hypothetical protein
MLRIFADGEQRYHRFGNCEARPSIGTLLASASQTKSEDAQMGIFDAAALALTFSIRLTRMNNLKENPAKEKWAGLEGLWVVASMKRTHSKFSQAAVNVLWRCANQEVKLGTSAPRGSA